MSIWPHPFLYSKKKKKKMGQNSTFARKKNGATGLKLGMQTQLDSANSMGWVPSGHTSSSLCIRLKMPKMIFIKKSALT